MRGGWGSGVRVFRALPGPTKGQGPLETGLFKQHGLQRSLTFAGVQGQSPRGFYPSI
ncbi:hypothetical protein AOE01nite_10590 [Acetobacter oeni]|uniref:Uncharacterized protein n=1 Tax=Acetobacter oeni TaxID=304077 RepID=A0A511XIR5_9PROT|nr:hypothetical protein AOE01nite_10590 [Acetobacter oeni]